MILVPDKNKVKKGLECCIESDRECVCPDDCPYDDDDNDVCEALVKVDALKLIEELEERVAIMEENRRWISTDDRMPRIGQRVFGAVYGSDIVILNEGETVIDALKRTMNDNPHTEMCVWHGDIEDWWSDGGLMIVEPRYWMPMDIPEPPEVGEDDA